MKINRSMSWLWGATIIIAAWLSGCSTMTGGSDPITPTIEKPTLPFEQSKTLFSQGQYEAAYNENQRILQEGKGAPDMALFNMGMISVDSANPKKNYPRALLSFRTLVKDYPRSELVEPAKAWIQVLEEFQKIADEKRTLTRERELLMQEKEKLKYTIEKSRQVDIDIERRRREALRK